MTTNATAIDLITRTLALLAITLVLTICILSCTGIKIPSELNTLTGTVVGGLMAMLVKTTPSPTPTTTGESK